MPILKKKMFISESTVYVRCDWFFSQKRDKQNVIIYS